ALTAGTAFDHGHWDFEGLTPVIDAVAFAGGAVEVLDQAGGQLVQSADFDRLPAETQMSSPVIVDGTRVGQVRVRFGPRGLEADVARLNTQRWHARVLAFVVAVLLALAVSVFVAGRITAPLDRLLAALRAREAGNRRARVTDLRAVGVLREILQAFNAA